MTTYQDPPLQSRRAARQNERGDVAPQQFGDAPANPSQAPNVEAPSAYSVPESLLYATQIPGTQPPPAQPPLAPSLPPQAQAPQAQAPQAQAPQSPDAASPAIRGRRVAETPAETAARTEAGYRVRDFSPEARRVAMQNWSQATTNDGSLTYQTQQRPPAQPAAHEQPIYPQPTYPQPVAQQPAAQQPVYQPPVVQPTQQPASSPPAAAVPYDDSSLVPEFTLSRRELRALREAQEAPDAAAVAAATAAEQVSAYEALFGAQQAAAQQAAAQQYVAPPQVQAVPEVPVVPVATPAVPEPAPVLAPAVPDDEPATASERPVGHWSRQAELDDEVQLATGSLARDVGIGALTTSALVLPEMPNHDFTRTVTSTGDVLVTGSINLPSSMSSTGAMSTQIDTSDIDHLLDIGDRQVTSTDSQPVRAVKAVSTHTSSRGIINAAPPKRGNRLLTALIVSACAMLVVVVGLGVVIVLSGVLN